MSKLNFCKYILLKYSIPFQYPPGVGGNYGAPPQQAAYPPGVGGYPPAGGAPGYPPAGAPGYPQQPYPGIILFFLFLKDKQIVQYVYRSCVTPFCLYFQIKHFIGNAYETNEMTSCSCLIVISS